MKKKIEKKEEAFIASTSRKFTIDSRQHPGGSGEQQKKKGGVSDKVVPANYGV